MWYVLYWRVDENPAHGKTRGAIADVGTQAFAGAKEVDPKFGHTMMEEDPQLLERLLSGQETVDVEGSTATEIKTCARVDERRMRATALVQNAGLGVDSGRVAAEPRVFEEYVETFLKEFTRTTAGIRLREKRQFYPEVLLQPVATEVLVGLDGVAIHFKKTERPESVVVVRSATQVLDEMLLPHPEGHAYEIRSPASVLGHICDDTHYLYLRGNGSVRRALSGNPMFVVLEARLHYFMESLWHERSYSDGAVACAWLEFVEIFGDPSAENFTSKRAVDRAKAYAELWAAAGIVSPEKERKAPKTLLGIRQSLDELRSIVRDGDKTEPEIEKFLDDNTWMLERGLGYRCYYSQIEIPRSLLSTAPEGIKPDKFMESHDGFCDVLDLKLPGEVLIVGSGNRVSQSAKLSSAIAQVETYCDLVSEPDVRDFLREHGVRVLSPRGLLLMGRRDAAREEDTRRVLERANVQVVTYDELVEELEELVGWVDSLDGLVAGS